MQAKSGRDGLGVRRRVRWRQTSTYIPPPGGARKPAGQRKVLAVMVGYTATIAFIGQASAPAFIGRASAPMRRARDEFSP
jgi:hypothetical protein